MDLRKTLARRPQILHTGDSLEVLRRRGSIQDCSSGGTKTENRGTPLHEGIHEDLDKTGHASSNHSKATPNLQGVKGITFARATETNGKNRPSEIGGYDSCRGKV